MHVSELPSCTKHWFTPVLICVIVDVPSSSPLCMDTGMKYAHRVAAGTVAFRAPQNFMQFTKGSWRLFITTLRQSGCVHIVCMSGESLGLVSIAVNLVWSCSTSVPFTDIGQLTQQQNLVWWSATNSIFNCSLFCYDCSSDRKTTGMSSEEDMKATLKKEIFSTAICIF